MAIALVRQNVNAATSGTSASLSLAASPAVGALVVITQIGNAGRISSVSGFGVTTWAVAKPSAFSQYAADIWYGIVDGTPSASATATLDASTFRGISVSEWSGIDTSAPLLAQSDTDNAGSGTAASTGPITGGASPCLYVSVLAVSGGRTASSPTGSFTGLTVANAGNVMRNYSAYRIDTTAASATSGWTISGSGQWEMAIAAFKGAAAAPVTVTPGTASLTTTLFIPTVTTTDHQLVIPSTAGLVTTLFAPTVVATDHQTVTPGVVSLTLTAFAPTVVVTEDVFVTPGTAELATTAYAPTVSVTGHQTVVPGTAALSLATFAPTVSATADVTVTPDPAALAITTFAPTVTTGDSVTVTPGTASLSLTAFAPTVVLTDHQTVTPAPASLSMTAFAPDVVITDHQVVVPGVASLVLTGYAPMVVVPTADISDAVALLEAAPMPVASLAGAVHPRASLSSAPMPHVTEVS